MRVAVTGHMNLTPDTAALVRDAVRARLLSYQDGAGDGAELVGISCVAAGADQIFAAELLAVGGALEVVLPAESYRERKVKPDNLAAFDALISQARTVRCLPYADPGPDAYAAANELLLGTADRLLAVWDGVAAAGKGGTADMVAAARGRALPVDVVWPDGSRRG